MQIVSVPYPEPQSTMALRLIGSITDIIIHHSAGSPNQSVLNIDREHRARGMAMIGYNYLVMCDGTVCMGRPVQYIPAAAYGRNSESINVCVLGNFEEADPGYTGPPTKEQVASLEALLTLLHHQYPSVVRTIGHRDVATLFYPASCADYSTVCPGSKLYSALPGILASVRYTLLKT